MNAYVFDIETVAMSSDELKAIIPAFDPESVKTGNMGPEKAAEKIEKTKAEQFNRFMRDAALSAFTGRVAMIGVRDATGSVCIDSSPDEKTVISNFFGAIESERGAHWLGFNIASFDIPFLLRRAWFHRLAVPYGIVKGRYLSSRFTDLLALWNASEYAGRFTVSLNDLAEFFGVGTKSADGANFGELLRYKPEAAREYLVNDLEITWKVAEAMGALKTEPAEPANAGPEPEPGPPIDELIAERETEIQFY